MFPVALRIIVNAYMLKFNGVLVCIWMYSPLIVTCFMSIVNTAVYKHQRQLLS